MRSLDIVLLIAGALIVGWAIIGLGTYYDPIAGKRRWWWR